MTIDISEFDFETKGVICNETDDVNRTSSVPISFSVIFWIRTSSSIWNPVFTQSCTQIIRMIVEGELNSLFSYSVTKNQSSVLYV